MDIKTVLAEKRILIEDYLRTLFNEENNLLCESMAYSLRAGGKRLRPSLFLITAELFGLDCKKVLPFAAAIEMIHTYSLIHDDLPAMDNDDYRRGHLTNHKVFGEAQAILAGDGLLTEAFGMMCDVGDDIPADHVLKAVALASSSAGIYGMVLGQTKDIAAEGKKLTLNELRFIHHDKTGALISLATVAAGILAGADEKDQNALNIYGYQLGLAFQIVDDILDHESTFEELGKPIGSDEENGKTTYISLLGLEGAKKAAKDAADLANANAANLSVDGSVLIALCNALLDRRK